jgi:hypothetical protein
MIKYFTITILLILTSYGFQKAWPLITGPALSIDSPIDNVSSATGIVTISGKVARAAILTIDGTPVLHEEDGKFRTILTFPRGGSILTFVATDRFGRMVTSTRSIFVL